MLRAPLTRRLHARRLHARQLHALTICGGTVVLDDGGQLIIRKADIGVDKDGQIAEIAPPNGLKESSAEFLDATDLLVAPGGVDSHCHIEQRTSTGLTPCDDFYTASVAALCGGTTTLIPFACQHKGQRVRDAVEDYRAVADARGPACDFAFHLIVSDPAAKHAVEDIEWAVREYGITSIKVYMTYDALMLSDTEMLDVLALCRKHGALLMVHAESHELVQWTTNKLLDHGLVLPKYHAIARHEIGEREATHRAISFAEFVGTPLLVVHVSAAQAADEIARARAGSSHTSNGSGSGRGSGSSSSSSSSSSDSGDGHGDADAAPAIPIFGETCPQYLVLSADHLKGRDVCTHMHPHEHPHEHPPEHAEGGGGSGGSGGQALCDAAVGEWEGAKFLCSPPLRPSYSSGGGGDGGRFDHQAAMWKALQRGTLQVVSSDHSAYNFEPPPSAAGHGANRASKLMHVLGDSLGPSAGAQEQGQRQGQQAGDVAEGSGGPDVSTDFSKVPMGLPGLELRMPLVWSHGVVQAQPQTGLELEPQSAQTGKLSVERFVEVCCTNPARLYGLYPRKGTIRVGADADFSIWDPRPETGFTVEHARLHDGLDYTPYEGIEMRGALHATVMRGQVVYRRQMQTQGHEEKGECKGEGEEGQENGQLWVDEDEMAEDDTAWRGRWAADFSEEEYLHMERGRGKWLACDTPDLLGWEPQPIDSSSAAPAVSWPTYSDCVLEKARKL